jgi:hypothetical protein
VIRLTLYVLRLLVCLALSFLIFLSLTSTVLSNVAGTASSASAFTLSVTSSLSVRQAFATHVVATITNATSQLPSSRAYAALLHDRKAMVTSLTTQLDSPIVISRESSLIKQLYHAAVSSTPTSLNLAKVIDPLTATLHSFAPVVPLHPAGLGTMTSDFTPSPLSHSLNAIGPSRHYLLLATALLALIAILFIRIRSVSVLFTVTTPIVVFFTLGYVTTLVSPSFHFGDPLTHSIVSAIMVRVGNEAVHVALLAVVPAVLIVALAISARHWSLFLSRSRARSSASL